LTVVPRAYPHRGDPPHADRVVRHLPGRIARAALAGSVAALLAVGTVAAGQPHPQTLFVAPNGSDSWPCSSTKPCATINHAIDVATPGSTIQVRKGTYDEQVIVTKKVRLIGHHATIDATGQTGGIEPLAGNGIVGYGVLIFGPGAAGASFANFTVENAIGEGILAAGTSKVAIRNNVVEHNDTGTGTDATLECQDNGAIPGDCGEAIHLLSVTWSQVTGNRVEHNVGGILVTDEIGPSSHNLIGWNYSAWNVEDCGITLPSHNGQAMADPSAGGVYDNWVIGNISEHNGGAGVGMFAPFPGTASYDNHVLWNRLIDNGEAGIAIHSHAPYQNVSGNVMSWNYVSGNGVDPDSGSPYAHNGIVVFSAADAQTVTVSHNWIANEDVGIYQAGPVTINGLGTNSFSGVGVPVD
jgi:nitrous oxidase accessory protein NosD